MARPKKVKTSNTKDSTIDRATLLQKAIADINKKFKGNIVKLASEELPKEKISTGVPKIDALIGGGWVKGNFNLVWGPEKSGKSSLAYSTIAHAQSLGLSCVYLDLEHSYSNDRAVNVFGVDANKLLLVEEAETAEQAMDLVIDFCMKKVVDLVVVDSIQGMTPKHAIYKDSGNRKSMEDESVALLARKLGAFFTGCSLDVYKANCAVLLIGQARTSGIGTFATKMDVSGGHALKHFNQLRLMMRRGQASDCPTAKILNQETGEKEEVRIGFDAVIELEKTKTSGSAMEGTKLHIPYYFQSGFNEPETIKISEQSEEQVNEPEQDNTTETGSSGDRNSKDQDR